MKEINFKNFKFEENSFFFDFSIIIDGQKFLFDKIYFNFNRHIHLNNNVIAYVLTTLTGNMYDKINLDLKLSYNVVKNIENFTQSNLTCSEILNEKYSYFTNTEKVLVNFSGGFDSLAILTLIPKEKIKLISIAWDGFERESKFFEIFKPLVVKTNFRKFVDQTKVEHLAGMWQFMGLGSMFYNENLRYKYQIFGTIFEGFPLHGSYKYSRAQSFPEHPFDYVGISDLKIIQGLTEVGTALLVCKQYPYLINDSLNSLARRGSVKFHRKQLLIEILEKKYGFDNLFFYKSKSKDYSKMKMKWGYFTDDFLVFWYIKHLGFKEVEKFISGMPDDIEDFVNSHELNFYEKFNVNYLNNVPESLKNDILSNLISNGILPYDELDYKELYDVLNYMKWDYPVLSRNWDGMFEYKNYTSKYHINNNIIIPNGFKILNQQNKRLMEIKRNNEKYLIEYEGKSKSLDEKVSSYINHNGKLYLFKKKLLNHQGINYFQTIGIKKQDKLQYNLVKYWFMQEDMVYSIQSKSDFGDFDSFVKNLIYINK